MWGCTSTSLCLHTFTVVLFSLNIFGERLIGACGGNGKFRGDIPYLSAPEKKISRLVLTSLGSLSHKQALPRKTDGLHFGPDQYFQSVVAGATRIAPLSRRINGCLAFYTLMAARLFLSLPWGDNLELLWKETLVH